MTDIISCIIPTYNRAPLLQEAIESTLAQTYPHWELIVVDDGSTDHTEALVKQYAQQDSRIRYFQNPKKGGSSARNYGIRMAQGRYIAFLDDDDVHLPHRFISQLKAIHHSGKGFIVSGYQMRDRATNKLISEHKLELKAAAAGFPSRWLLRKDLLESVNGFDEDFPSMQEIELSYKLAEHEIYALHNDVVAILYLTSGSVSRSKENAIRGRILLLERNESRMNPVEAAYWYYVIGMEYYKIGKKGDAILYLKKAAERDSRGIYHSALTFYRLANTLDTPFKRLNMKILSFLRDYRFPTIVEHPIV
ncbi:MAG: glycosyltransferase family 2 protein [Saprospiraceae bacterium]